MTTQFKSKAEIKAEQKAQQEAKTSNTATLDRPVCDEIKSIFVTSMTSTYEACVDARNRGISAGIERFRRENTTGDDDFFADWEVEAEQILVSRSPNQNVLPSFQVVIDLDNLDQYDIQTLRDRHNYLADLNDLDDGQQLEKDLLRDYLLPRLEASNPCPDLSSDD